MVTPEIFDSMYQSVMREADSLIMWAQTFATIGLGFIAFGAFVAYWGAANRKKKEDWIMGLVICWIVGFACLLLVGGINLSEAEDRRSNPLLYIRGKTEWHMLVVRPAEEAALRSIMEEYESRGLKNEIWTNFPTTPKSLPTQLQTSSPDLDPSQMSLTTESLGSE